jgi:hypothetical protein
LLMSIICLPFITQVKVTIIQTTLLQSIIPSLFRMLIVKQNSLVSLLQENNVLILILSILWDIVKLAYNHALTKIERIGFLDVKYLALTKYIYMYI